ncbi:tyrosinase family protein [Bradyrhizobium jicamae]|uniref:Tyrosinase family protein n=1 Tax=Bradyrhizobium jicamae TaxID=280332 RepID=A0ABS5FGA5_9BRAD|nr:tyrosinase family protein [Bradyrhizobium jicamae]MBR0795777.1 tyrosinase family protein [Bradyrhizobium jicamae]MBR0933799.1 tyrosinase family protein [Bradyrhizobium jicamae]
MMQADVSSLTRRRLLGAGAALAATAMLPSGARAQGAQFRRWEITDPAMPPRVLASYKTGISKMLALPPTDPRNWYRNAMVHLFDCPHGNWWFLVWHRAYLGWLETTLRDLSGDPDFALPYWDWTKTPSVPQAMFDGVLDPNNSGFIPTFDEFSAQFRPVVTTLYASFSQDQLGVLNDRGIATADDFMNLLPQVFFDQPSARGLTATNPDLDSDTRVAVSLPTIRSSLRTTQFAGDGGPNDPAGFASAKAPNHSAGSTKGILESQPHDNVHGAMGGGGGAFMVQFYSPVDPIFFLHHGNLDRLWDVWTRRQTALGRPTLPQGPDLDAWSNEQFRFFSNAQSQPVTQTNAGSYALPSVFGYDYSPGSGEDQVPAAGPVIASNPQVFSGAVLSERVGSSRAAGGTVRVPASALQAARADAGPRVAEITLNLTHEDLGRRFRVLVSPTPGVAPLAAGAITIFGHPHHGPVTFTVPLPNNLPAAGTTGEVSLDIRVVPIGNSVRPALAAGAAPTAPLVSGIKVRTD